MQHLGMFLQRQYTVASTHVPLTRPRHIAETYCGAGNILCLQEGAAKRMAKGKDIYVSDYFQGVKNNPTIHNTATLFKYVQGISQFTHFIFFF